MKRVVVAVVLTLSQARDLGETLSAESTEDASASDKATCWCKQLEETLDTRSREADAELNYWEKTKTAQHYENEALRIEVAAHKDEAADHQHALDQGNAISSKKQKSYEEERDFHENAVKSVQKAMAAIPEGSGEEVKGALRGLEDQFTDKMEEADSQHSNNMQDVLDSKAEMLRLANSAASAKQKRLSDGEADVGHATGMYGAYQNQTTADSELSVAVQNLCQELPNQAQERERLRQQALVAISTVNAEIAQKASQAAFSKFSLIRRSSNLRASHSAKTKAKSRRELDSELKELIIKGEQVEADMVKLLNNVVHEANWGPSSGPAAADARVETALQELAKTAEADVQKLPPLFAAVKLAALKSLKADKEI